MQVFNTDAYINVSKEKRQKCNLNNNKKIIIGYDGESINYRPWDKEICKIYISSDVDFNEINFRVEDKEIRLSSG